MKRIIIIYKKENRVPAEFGCDGWEIDRQTRIAEFWDNYNKGFPFRPVSKYNVRTVNFNEVVEIIEEDEHTQTQAPPLDSKE